MFEVHFMKIRRYTIILTVVVAIAALVAGCSNHQKTSTGTIDEGRYQWESIRKCLLEEPDRALAMVDTAQMLGVADVNYANWMRAQIHLAKGSNEDLDKAREYCLEILDNQNPVVDSLQRVATYHVLVGAGRPDSRTWQDAIGYAIEGARISHEYGWAGDEAMFYFDAGDIMEKVQAGSGTEYLDRSLEMFRASSKVKALPNFSNYLGRVARLAANHEDWPRAISLMQERLRVVDRIEKEYTTAPAGFVDQQRAYTYCVLAYCQCKAGDKAAAARSALAFEATRASRSPEQQADILSYYIASGNKERINQICAVLEPYYKERLDTVSTNYASWLILYADALDRTGRSHEAYEQLGRHMVLADSLVQRERRAETLKYAQQMKTQEKEIQLKDEEAKTAVYRTLAFSLLAIMIVICVALWLLAVAHRRELIKNRELYEVIQREQRREVRDIQRMASQPEQERTPGEQIFLRIVALMNKEQPYTNAELNRDTLAAMLATNHRYVDDAIRECSDAPSTNAFINSYRVDHAARLLTSTDDSISLIAEMSGFANRTTFNEQFRSRYKMTPSEYRKAAKA